MLIRIRRCLQLLTPRLSIQLPAAPPPIADGGLSRLWRMLRSWPTALLEVGLVGLALGWGLWVILLPGSIASTGNLRVMANLAPGWAWGLLLLCVAGLHGWTLLWSARSGTRTILALLSLWLIIWATVLLSNPLAPAVWTYGWVALGHAFVYIRLRLDRSRHVE